MLSTRLNFILLFILTLHCNRIFNEPSRPSSPNCTPPQNQCQYKPTPYKFQPKQHPHFAYREGQHLSMQALCFALPNDVVHVVLFVVVVLRGSQTAKISYLESINLRRCIRKSLCCICILDMIIYLDFMWFDWLRWDKKCAVRRCGAWRGMIPTIIINVFICAFYSVS